MGITISNKEKSIDMGCGGFYNLRKNIAYLLCEDFGRLYESWISPLSQMDDEMGNIQLMNLFNVGLLKEEDEVILDFLFASDCAGKISSKDCCKLYALIKDYDDNILYGYVGRPDCARFKDFKEIVKQSAKNRWIVSWH